MREGISNTYTKINFPKENSLVNEDLRSHAALGIKISKIKLMLLSLTAFGMTRAKSIEIQKVKISGFAGDNLFYLFL